jgi:polar amino acid transport system substrate-binding protein
LIFSIQNSNAEINNNELPVLVFCSTNEPLLNSKDYSGFLDELINKLLFKIRYKVEIQNLPKERCLYNLNNGYIDGDVSRINGLENIYKSIIPVPENTMTATFGLYSFKPIKPDFNWDNLKEKNVAYIRGWKIFDLNVPKSSYITKVKSLNQLFELLEKQRIDYFLYGNVFGFNELYETQNMKLKFHKLAQKDMFIYLNNKHKNLVPKLSEALIEMKKNGEYDILINKHFNQ